MAILALGLVIVACGSSYTPEDLEGVVVQNPTPKPAFSLTDTGGENYSFVERTEGKLTLLYFGYTRCPDICPMHLFQMAQTLEANPDVAANTEVVFISTDPEYDDAETIREYLDIFDEGFIGLTASRDELLNLGQLFGLTLAVSEEVEGTIGFDPVAMHPAWVTAYAPDGLNYAMYPFGVTQQQWDNDIPILNTFR